MSSTDDTNHPKLHSIPEEYDDAVKDSKNFRKRRQRRVKHAAAAEAALQATCPGGTTGVASNELTHSLAEGYQPGEKRELIKREHLERAHLPGAVRTDLLVPLDLNSLSLAEREELHAHPSLSHLPTATVDKILARTGIDMAKLLGSHLKGVKDLMAQRGADPALMPFKLPLHPAEEFDPTKHVLSLSLALPFKGGELLPFLGETLRKVMDTEGENIATWLTTLPFLPMPIVCGMAPHTLFQQAFPPVMNSWVWLKMLQCVLIQLRRASDIVRAEVKQRLFTEHTERYEIWQRTMEAIYQEFEQWANTRRADGRPDKLLLYNFNEAILDGQLNYVRSLERSVISFYERRNQPERLQKRSAEDDHGKTLAGQTWLPADDGIPDEFVDTMWTQLLKLPGYAGTTRPEVALELLQEVESMTMSRADAKMFNLPSYKADYVPPLADTPAENETAEALADLEPRFYLWSHVQSLWDAVIGCETPLADTPWYVDQCVKYDTNLLAARPPASIVGVDGHVIVHNGTQLPPVPDLIADLPDHVPQGEVFMDQ